MTTVKTTNLIRKIYLYLVSVISIIVFVISSVGLINIVLSEYVFNVKSYQEMDAYWECSEYTINEEPYNKCAAETDIKRADQHLNDVKRDFVMYISMLIVALPLFLFHWSLIKREEGK